MSEGVGAVALDGLYALIQNVRLEHGLYLIHREEEETVEKGNGLKGRVSMMIDA